MGSHSLATTTHFFKKKEMNKQRKDKKTYVRRTKNVVDIFHKKGKVRKLIIITVIESFTLFTARALREVIRGQDLGRSSRKCAFIQRKSLAGIFPNFSQIVRATYGTKFQPGFC